MLFIGQPNYETISSNKIGSIIAKAAKPEEKQLLMKRELYEWKKLRKFWFFITRYKKNSKRE
jgi:hypothetical protein